MPADAPAIASKRAAKPLIPVAAAALPKALARAA
jgi:hypothetical protein